jgi:membrane-bound metal-dependent hydrolase YbcI (DUF457 family)
MPNHRTHLVAGLATAASLFFILARFKSIPFTETHYFILCYTLCLTGSIFPDIDVASKMQRIFLRVAVIACILAIIFMKWFLFVLLGILTTSLFIIKHRGITHKIWFLVLFPLLITGYIAGHHVLPKAHLTIFYIFFVTGAISHIALDKLVGLWRRKKLFTQRQIK